MLVCPQPMAPGLDPICRALCGTDVRILRKRQGLNAEEPAFDSALIALCQIKSRPVSELFVVQVCTVTAAGDARPCVSLPNFVCRMPIAPPRQRRVTSNRVDLDKPLD